MREGHGGAESPAERHGDAEQSVGVPVGLVAQTLQEEEEVWEEVTRDHLMQHGGRGAGEALRHAAPRGQIRSETERREQASEQLEKLRAWVGARGRLDGEREQQLEHPTAHVEGLSSRRKVLLPPLSTEHLPP